MLLNLNVKNVALIREGEISLGSGLNILTGETGAGKSIIIGSVNVALGMASFKDFISPEDAPYSLVELTFDKTKKAQEALERLELPCEDDVVIIQRRYQNGRSISRINGETVPLKSVRELAGELIDIHGQNQHQTLLYPRFHRMMLDRYAGEALKADAKKCASQYHEYRKLMDELEQSSVDTSDRMKKIDMLRFEIQEIEEASLKPGEDEELEKNFRLMENGQKIMEALTAVEGLTDADSGAGDSIGRGVRMLSSVSTFDEQLGQLYEELLQIEDMMNDFGRSLSSYMDDFSYDEHTYYEISKRLDQINHLKSKYGHSIEEVLAYLEKNQAELEKLEHYEDYIDELRLKVNAKKKELLATASKITATRKKYAAVLEKQIHDALVSLNFLDVNFKIAFETMEEPGEYGQDEVTFMISTNPGSPVAPIWEVASGGELSRIMLAIKSVMADQDSIGTLIFDEIDTGISGRTAQKVAERMDVIARSHQVICITHLAQIAAMADNHFEIYKTAQDGHTRTCIRPLDEGETVTELARILGGAEITDTVKASAQEMIRLANEVKEKNRQK